MDKYIGRIVVLITPVILGLAAWFSTWAAEHLPGAPNIPASDIAEVAVAGVLAAGAAIYKWLSNRGNFERDNPTAIR